MVSYISGRWWRWKFWNVLQVALFLVCIARTVLSCQGECDETLTASDGIFTSPCYPNDYPPSQTCTWTLQAPAGFVLQLTFLDFELEEAQGCIYDSVIVNTGASSVKFCGLTANGLTLNSSTNVMVVSFHSDFSVQKKGFSISYRQVAVALRNQKVTVPQNFKDVVQVSSSVSIPALSQFTACFEIAGNSQTGSGIIFSYTGVEPHLSFGNNGNSMDLTIGNATCPVSDLVTLADFTVNLQLFCITWSNTNGAVAVFFKGNYRGKFCSSTVGMKLGTGGSFELGRGKKQGQNFDGLIYDFRLWSSAMTSSELSTLTCDAVGNVVDWDNSFWDIPASYAQTDSSLSCICYPQCVHLTTTVSSSGTAMPATTSQTTSCVSPGVGCPASLTTTTSSIVNTNTIPTNARTNDITISYTTTPSISLPATTVKTTPSATTYSPTTASTPTEHLNTTTTTTTLPLTAAATNPLPNHASSEKGTAVFFWSLLRLPPRSAAVSSAPPPSQPPVAPAGRSSKTSLGFISTPLIWPVRKKSETAVTQAPKYPAVHMTKVPPLPTKSMTIVSPELRIPEALTNAKKTNFTTRRPAYSHVLWPHNQTENVESFQVVSVSNRKKPLTPQWDLSESNENSSEELDFPSGFGSESFLYDIDLDENIFSLFEFDATYSLDEGLATTSPNISLLEMASVPSTTDNAPFEQVETQNSMMLITAPGGSDVQMNQSGLSRLTEQTTEPPSLSRPAISPTYSSLVSTVRWYLPEVTTIPCVFTDVKRFQQGCTKVSPMLQPTVIAHGQAGTLEEPYGRTAMTETQNKLTETTPSIAASLKYFSDYIPFQTGLFTEPLTVGQYPSRSSYPLGAEAHPTLYISPMPAMEVQREYAIRPTPLSLAAISSTPTFASGAKDSGDLALPQSENLFISAQNTQNNNFKSLSTPSLVASYLVTEGTIAASLVASQSKLDSLQWLEPSHVHRPQEPLYRSLNRQKDYNPSVADQWGLSYASHISVSSSSELPPAATPILTDKWGSSPSSPLNSSFEMRTQRDDGLPMFSSTSDSNFDSSFMSSPDSLYALEATEGDSVMEMGGYSGNEAALSDFRIFTVSLPSPSLSHSVPLDFQRGPSVSQNVKGHSNYIDDSQDYSVMLQLSNILADESVFPFQSKDFDESTTANEMHPFPDISTNSWMYTRTHSDISTSRPYVQIYKTTSTTASTDTDYRSINPTSTYCQDRTVAPIRFYSSMISGTAITEHTGTNTLTISQSKLLHKDGSLIASSVSSLTSVLTVDVPQLPHTEHDHMSGFSQVTSGFHHASTFPSRQSWPSTLEASVHSLGLDIHPVDTSTVSEDIQDTKHAQFSTTEQLFWSENESAKPSSNSNNVLIVQPITTDREMHPSPPAAYDQAFVSTNGTLPLASPPKGVTADFHSVPTDATHGTTTDAPEFIPCPCKTFLYSSCHCGLSTGNSMFSNNDIDRRKRYSSFLIISLLLITE